MVTPSCVFSRPSSFRKSSTVSESIALKGSSRIKRDGFSISACAMARRCFIPSEYLATLTLEAGSRPTSRITPSSSSFVTFFKIPAIIERFFSPVSLGRKPALSKITPMFRGNLPFSILSPSTITSPSSGRTSPQIILSSTLFPAPFTPTMAQLSPRCTLKFKSVNSTLLLYAFFM